jgi:hypothetical protein
MVVYLMGVLEHADFYDTLQNECLKIPESSDVKGRKLPCLCWRRGVQFKKGLSEAL